MYTRRILLVVIITVANAAVMIIPFQPIPKELEHKQGCYIEEIHDVIPFGETASLLGSCLAKMCREEHLLLATCGSTAVPPGCFLTDRESSRPYEKCCPQVRCDLDENPIAE